MEVAMSSNTLAIWPHAAEKWYFTQLIPPDALPFKNHPVQHVTFKLETQPH
jgi:hypothetical protein